MSIWSKYFSKNTPPKVVVGETNTEIQKVLDALYLPSFTFNADDARRVVALTICSRILAQDFGRLPVKVYKTVDGNKTVMKEDFRYLLLHNHPNSYTDSYTFWSTIEYLRSFEGNAYVRIHRDINLKPESLEIISNDRILGPTLVENQLWYGIKNDKDELDEVKAKDILHFRNISSDGLKGRDPKDDLNLNLGISFKALTVIDNYYNRGAIGNLVLESTIPEGIDAVEWSKQNDVFAEKYGGYLKSNQLITTPPYTKLIFNNINFDDAQLIETIKYNNGQVAAYFGIPPHKIGNSESTKFNDLLQLNNDYVNNTIAPIITMYRRELEFKLLEDEEILEGYSIDFESGALLMTDSKTRMENYKNLFGLGAITPNKVAQLENLPSFEGGESHYLMSNYQSVEAYNAKLKSGTAPIKQSGEIPE